MSALNRLDFPLFGNPTSPSRSTDAGYRRAPWPETGCGGRSYAPRMIRMNHVNMGLPVGGKADMIGFLELLGFHPAPMSEKMRTMGATWFEADDGMQIHLSEDPEHRAAARAHVAVDFGDELDDAASRLQAAGIPYEVGGNPELRVLFCQDPGGNRWELRGVASPTG